MRFSQNELIKSYLGYTHEFSPRFRGSSAHLIPEANVKLGSFRELKFKIVFTCNLYFYPNSSLLNRTLVKIQIFGIAAKFRFLSELLCFWNELKSEKFSETNWRKVTKKLKKRANCEANLKPIWKEFEANLWYQKRKPHTSHCSNFGSLPSRQLHV